MEMLWSVIIITSEDPFIREHDDSHARHMLAMAMHSVITAKLQSILDDATYQLSPVQCSTFVVNNNGMYNQSHDNTWFTKSKRHNSMTNNNLSVQFKVSYMSSLRILMSRKVLSYSYGQ